MTVPEWASKPEFWESTASVLSLIVSLMAIGIAKRDSSTREALNTRVDGITAAMRGIANDRDALERQLAAQDQAFQRQLAQERANFDARLSRQDQARKELHHLKDALSTALNSFGALVSRPHASNEELIRSAREAIDTIGPLRQAASRALVLKSRHKRELDQLEKYLTEVLLDITRDDNSRSLKQYLDMSKNHEACLEGWRRRATWLIDAAVIGVKSAGSPAKRVTNERSAESL